MTLNTWWTFLAMIVLEKMDEKLHVGALLRQKQKKVVRILVTTCWSWCHFPNFFFAHHKGHVVEQNTTFWWILTCSLLWWFIFLFLEVYVWPLNSNSTFKIFFIFQIYSSPNFFLAYQKDHGAEQKHHTVLKIYIHTPSK